MEESREQYNIFSNLVFYFLGPTILLRNFHPYIFVFFSRNAVNINLNILKYILK